MSVGINGGEQLAGKCPVMRKMIGSDEASTVTQTEPMIVSRLSKRLCRRTVRKNAMMNAGGVTTPNLRIWLSGSSQKNKLRYELSVSRVPRQALMQIKPAS